MNKKQLYFPNLNGLRAIAAFMVIIFHIELIKSEFKIPNILSRFHLGGDLGVILFFVLSGFLITYLLLEEDNQNKTILLKNFYIRRILRIWPLYFFVVTICLFLLPKINLLAEPAYSQPLIKSFNMKIVLYFLFLGNILTSFYAHVNFARPTWSVGVEEQFYLIWPVLLKYSKNKLKTILVVFFTYWLIRIIILYINSSYTTPLIIKQFDVILHYTPFDVLSVGAITGYFLFHKKKYLNVIYNKIIQYIIFASLPILIYLFTFRLNASIYGFDLNIGTNLAYSILFAFVIINLAGNRNVIISLENKLFSYLGKISFGLYLYHWAVIVFYINLFNNLNFNYNTHL
jgi:peptidoglycan/LPS O-acetylase OafA/YrhL